MPGDNQRDPVIEATLDGYLTRPEMDVYNAYLRIALTYHPATDPYAVTVVFSHGNSDVSWVMGRDLLYDGCASHSFVGDGDMRVRMLNQSAVTIVLMTSDGTGTVKLSRPGLVRFLDRTFVLVPAGVEETWLDLDAELERYLG